jgi:hypothetical protein
MVLLLTTLLLVAAVLEVMLTVQTPLVAVVLAVFVLICQLVHMLKRRIQ